MIAAIIPKCRHCKRRHQRVRCRDLAGVPTYEANGLCHECNRVAALRKKYRAPKPPTDPKKLSPNKDFYGTLPPPDEPTDALPGSIEKIRVMAERAAQGRAIFHKGDYVDRD